MQEGVGDGGVRAHGVAGEHGTRGAQLGGEHRVEVGYELGVGVAALRGSGVGLPVAAGVVGDLAMALARENLRAVDDVAAGGGDPVKQHDRRSGADPLSGQSLAVSLDREPGWLDGARHDRPARPQAGGSARARSSECFRSSTSW